MDENQEHEFYRNPANQVPAGPAYRRQGRRLSATVPVRFPQSLIDAVKRLADRDGVTVSSWIRKLVTREVMRRQPADVTIASSLVRYEGWTPENTSPATIGAATPEQLEVECMA